MKTKCMFCGKEIDTEENVIPPKWFGTYRKGELLMVICDVCIKDQDKLAKYRKAVIE